MSNLRPLPASGDLSHNCGPDHISSRRRGLARCSTSPHLSPPLEARPLFHLLNAASSARTSEAASMRKLPGGRKAPRRVITQPTVAASEAASMRESPGYWSEGNISASASPAASPAAAAAAASAAASPTAAADVAAAPSAEDVAPPHP